MCKFGIKTDPDYRGEVLAGGAHNCGMSQTLVATRLQPHDALRDVASGLDD